MNENQTIKEEERESLEQMLDATPEWRAFGQILGTAHGAIYRKPVALIPEEHRTKSKRMFKRSVFLSAAALLLLALTFGLFHENKPRENDLTEYDPELDWDAGEQDLELFAEQLERIAEDDSSLELEYAIFGDSLSEWDAESREEELF